MLLIFIVVVVVIVVDVMLESIIENCFQIFQHFEALTNERAHAHAHTHTHTCARAKTRE